MDQSGDVPRTKPAVRPKDAPSGGPAAATGPARRLTARERVRAELTREIKESARAQLAAGGASSLSLRAISRELSMASSAIYRYYPSRDALLTALIIDAYDAIGAHVEPVESRVRRSDLTGRWRAICAGVRSWALANPHEYALIFGSPVPGYAAPEDTIAPAARVPNLLIALLVDLHAAGRSGRGQAAPLPRAVKAAIAPVRSAIPPEVPDELVVRGLMAWTYLFGALSFELFGQRQNVIGNLGVFFDHEMARIGATLGL
jgi:AcrR family transcriptional regulator